MTGLVREIRTSNLMAVTFASFARFYAEQLPPGTQEVHYYARAAQPGRSAALPAVAELMYGSAGVARTASTVLDVVGGKR